MYHGAQVPSLLTLCFTVGILCSNIFAQDGIGSTTTEPFLCPSGCICLSSKQVLCNTGGLKEIPTYLNQGIEDLSLSKNDFSTIESDAFKGLRHLRKLSLDSNNITVIKPFAFRGLTTLTDLSIQYTPLSYIGQYSFATLHNVTLILLAHNRIKYIEEFSFAGTSNIKLILLTNNPIVTIHSKAFSGLNNVERLIFPSGIRTIEPDAFNGLSNVGLLKLTFMDLTSLLPYTFRGLSHVQLLNIQESDLGTIKADAFTDSDHIDNLYILNNKIDFIEELKLTGDNAVGELRFQGNHVLRSPRAKNTWLNVHSISAQNNYFACDCLIHELFDSDFTNGSVQQFRKNNFCISPLEYHGSPMSEIDFDLIARCHDKVVQDNLGSSAPSFIRHFIIIISIFYAIQ
ncbi:GSCOCG00001416001-RA-CDS [Cotesia congregata]|uniref:Similar to Igfals: Insulin-like growth factor-binding protein complex acid labile subunit (Mus musculus) n=1 Tax=Cotesia congregata TaxID=51543 RepID=A0A8J2H5K7_COTCN|nr:GSCOCG00001416001-RA-CDS [Cotesia congregata]CAG5076683.1 Similar to Igfals: Insulin-like growth factor-binding protein complex acid labile subunit (Mus musculus) [Cotesia congregata]